MIKGLLNRQTMIQGFRFIITGLIAALVDFGVYYALYHPLGVYISKAVSFVTATLFTFLLNKFWTFNTGKMSAFEIIRFVAFYAVSMTVNNLVNKYVLYLSGEKLLGFIAATGVCALLNFFGLKWFVFRNKPKNAQP